MELTVTLGLECQTSHLGQVTKVKQWTGVGGAHEDRSISWNQ